MSLDGTVHPLFDRTLTYTIASPISLFMTNLASEVAQSAIPNNTETTATYYVADHLSSSRLMLNLNGWPVWQATYMPYGEEVEQAKTPNHFRFTGKERDAESGLDYFGARYNSASLARFVSPDFSNTPQPVPFASFGSPQSLNLFAYCLNNPIVIIDESGHEGAYHPLSGKWDIRIDKTNPNDYPNVHLRKGGVEVARGKVNPDGTFKWDEYKTLGAGIKAEAEAFAKSKGVVEAAVERQKLFLEKQQAKLQSGKAGGLEGAASKALAVAQIVAFAVDTYASYESLKTEGSTGFHLDPIKGVVVTNLAKAASSLAAGTQLNYQGETFTLNENHEWVNGFGEKLVQKDDQLYVQERAL